MFGETKREMPDHVEPMEGSYMCKHCGGSVGEDGVASSGEEDIDDMQEEQTKVENPAGSEFSKALRRGLNSKVGE